MPAATQTVCYNCFQQVADPAAPCPHCGFDLEENRQKFPVALRAGTVLNDRYIVGRVLGQGGFGITYVAFDTQLQARVAIKEYMPSDIATRVEGATVSVMMDTKADDFTYGAERFQEEARTLAKFIGHPNIAGVSSYFDQNDTSYFVMDYIEGVSFKSYIANNGGKVSVDETLNVMIPVLRALTAVHAEGFIHRDVTPDNIYISKDGNVKLLDFGSARYSIGDKSKSLDVILKVGYAPKEQYIRRGRQGPFTDVYSCAACFYAALTGYLPPESLERLDHDELVPVSQAGVDIPEWLDKAILKGLAVQPEDRFQSAAEFLDAIENQLVVDVPVSGQGAPVQPAKKLSPLVIGGIAAAIVVAVGLGAVLGGRGGTTVDPKTGEVVRDTPLKRAEVPSITIQGEEYSTDLRKLDLSNRGLTDGDILDLKYMINLTDLRLGGNNLTDLTPVAGLTDLRYIDLRENPDLTDMSPVSGLTNLEEITYYNTGVTDYSFMAGLTGLKHIELSNLQEDTDLSFLSNMTNATSIYCNGNSGTGISDLSFLSGMTSLQEIGIQVGYMDEVDLSPIAGLTSLTRLQLYSNGQRNSMVKDLSPLAGLTKLQDLNLSVETDNLDALANLKDLRELRLYGGNNYAHPVDISGLSGLTKLTSLNLQSIGDVEDLSPLKGLTGLTELYFHGNLALTDCTPFENMTNLRTLNIGSYSGGSGSGLANLSSFHGLENLTELRELTISASKNNTVTDTSPLKNLTNLTKLDLDGFQSYESSTAVGLSGLAGLTKLQELRINGNLNDLTPLSGLTALRTLQIQSNGGPAFSLSPLSGLTKLQELQINGEITDGDLSPLSGLTELRSLSVYHYDRNYSNYYNRVVIRDLSPLAGLTKLNSLQVGETQEGIDTSPVAFVADLNIS